MVPADWNPIDSLAVLMLAVASADAAADRAELDAITALLRGLVPKAPERADVAVRRALDHWYTQLLPEVERDASSWIGWHCEQISSRYAEKVRRRMVLDMVAVAKASGGAQAAEIELAAGIADTWGLPALATTMLDQFQRAQRPG
ncbi:TerB family tellurite resistance protein [Myxococcota bacterium]|nr:TerB family tellurite resistance protein [Myxococcota bacterium]